MKTILYLPLIALIVLCSCKSNSFTKQRYTHFAHSSNKHTIAKKQTTKAENVIVEKEAATVETVEYVETASASQGGPVLFVKENLFAPIKIKLKTSDHNISKKEINQSEDSKTEFKHKKADSKKSDAKKVIGTVLKIVLWVVILAVVLSLIILVALLG